MVTVELTKREPRQIGQFTRLGPMGVLFTPSDFHAAIPENPEVWGSDKDSPSAAVGSALVTATMRVDGFSLPAGFREKTYSEIGNAAISGSLPNVTVVDKR